MRISVAILTAVFSCAAPALRAGEPVKGPFVSNDFRDNWYLSLGTGGQIYIGDDNGKAPLADRITAPLEISAGKWLHPAYGLRVQMTAGNNKGFATAPNAVLVSGPENSDGLYPQEWKHVCIHGDFMLDLSTLIAGYRPGRLYSALPYLGTGFDVMFDMKKKGHGHAAVHILGLVNRFRLSESLDANMEMKLTAIDKSFDHYRSNNGLEGYFTTTVSITWRIGKAGRQHFKKALTTTTVE